MSFSLFVAAVDDADSSSTYSLMVIYISLAKLFVTGSVCVHLGNQLMKMESEIGGKKRELVKLYLLINSDDFTLISFGSLIFDRFSLHYSISLVG